ncbi:KH domain-containing protein HEN4-like isoform X2 [Ipomoea triloba]|uniref:KH domain-containing protein HEN4-like isoform X2 n=1 Tax=Ipomoea triloba TaxID=35885 RepID=UPI00125DF370|nr:KH domain-containing protein HEN4-like isoform X2 [Ipomoea triloba]
MNRSETLLRLDSRQMMKFRMLCPSGLIGYKAAGVRDLGSQTGCRIFVENAVRPCLERVINVTGGAAVEMAIFLNDGTGELEMVVVSAAQEGLFRVLETILELEGNGDDEERVVECRLLVDSSHIRALMGETPGQNVDAIRRIHGATIKVLNKEHLPACIGKAEELIIQIMGRSLCVKRALVLEVSRCLQDCATGRIQANMSSGVMPINENRDRVLSVDEENVQLKIAFRLLCSNKSAGGVIGCDGTVVHALEKETGAAISFYPAVHGSNYRVAFISSLEKRDPVCPSAQNAVIRVFEKSMEVASDWGLISCLCNETIVTAKLLVARHELRCLIDDKGQIGTDIRIASGVKIKLSPTDLPQNLDAENDEVIKEIEGIGQTSSDTSATINELQNLNAFRFIFVTWMVIGSIRN